MNSIKKRSSLITFFITIFLSFPFFTSFVLALTTTPLELGNQYQATLVKCVDGDTANFKINGEVYKTRFLYIDAPESTNTIEPYGKEASDFTCSFLKNGTITIETDGKELFDKYDRLLAWIWVDNQLHQEAITKAGLVEGFYDYGNYKYEETIVESMEYARRNYVGMYKKFPSQDQNFGIKKLLGIVLALTLIIIFLLRKFFKKAEQSL